MPRPGDAGAEPGPGRTGARRTDREERNMAWRYESRDEREDRIAQANVDEAKDAPAEETTPNPGEGE